MVTARLHEFFDLLRNGQFPTISVIKRPIFTAGSTKGPSTGLLATVQNERPGSPHYWADNWPEIPLGLNGGSIGFGSRAGAAQVAGGSPQDRGGCLQDRGRRLEPRFVF